MCLEIGFLREDMLLQAFQYNPLDLCLALRRKAQAPAVSSGMRGSETKNGPDVVVGAVARQRRLAMHDLKPSLACFLIVLGQLCLMGEIEINLSVNFSVELSAVLTIVGAVVFANRK